MRSFFPFLAGCLFALLSCRTESPVQDAEWLTGTWKYESGGRTIYERWEMQDPYELSGISFFLEGPDTVLLETIRLAGRNDSLFYIPTIQNQNDGKPVVFRMAAISDSLLSFENPAHDFPQRITYWRRGSDSLVASIEGFLNGVFERRSFPMARWVQPHILLLVADDLGYADLGCYGGDIETPHIDRLAREGIRFSRFHTSPYCSPTRAMLLSGNGNHIAGIGRQGLVTEQFGYEGRLSDRVAIIPEVLKGAGYHTYMAGKWHLGTDVSARPDRRGFDRSFVNLGAGGNHFSDLGLFERHPRVPLMEDGEPAEWATGQYSTDLYTDKLIEYIGSNLGDGKPFFAFAAYTSPHWPLQVPESYREKYAGRYDEGYEELRRDRLRSLVEAGMIPSGSGLPPAHPMVIPWDSLPPSRQLRESRKMELYAGMVDNLDVNIGRILEFLEKAGELENTLIVFMSDNGAAAEDFYHHPVYGPFIQEHYTDTAYHQMGSPLSFVSYGPQWAEAGTAPFRFFKGMATQGAVLSPLVICGYGVNVQNVICSQFASLMDLAPAFYELAGAEYPGHKDGKPIYPMRGKSLAALMTSPDKPLHDSSSLFAIEHGERALLIREGWKLVHENPPFDRDSFRLFHLESDLAERNDLRETEMEKYKELLSAWDAYVKEAGITFPIPSE